MVKFIKIYERSFLFIICYSGKKDGLLHGNIAQNY